MSDAFIVVSSLSFSWPDDTPVFDGLSVSVPGGRNGLVAPNGAGKSTLLKLVAGALTPSGGSVSVEGVLGYLPQDLPLTAGLTVAEVLGVADVLRAIAAVESGDVGEEHFTTIGTDWRAHRGRRRTRTRAGRGGGSTRDRHVRACRRPVPEPSRRTTAARTWPVAATAVPISAELWLWLAHDEPPILPRTGGQWERYLRDDPLPRRPKDLWLDVNATRRAMSRR